MSARQDNHFPVGALIFPKITEIQGLSIKKSYVFCVVTQRQVVPYRRFGTTYWVPSSRAKLLKKKKQKNKKSRLGPLKVGNARSPETSVSNHLTLHNNPEQEIIYSNRGEEVRSHIPTNTFSIRDVCECNKHETAFFPREGWNWGILKNYYRLCVCYYHSYPLACTKYKSAFEKRP